MPETVTDERRKAVEKVARAGHRAICDNSPKAEEWWNSMDGRGRGSHLCMAEAALDSVDYFPLLEVAEAAKAYVGACNRIGYMPLPSEIDADTAIDQANAGRELFAAVARLNALPKSEEAKGRG